MHPYQGLPTRELKNTRLSLEYLAEAGPRIVRVTLNGTGENFLAEVAGAGMETQYGTYHVRGGHRLWHSPESIPRTYLPDNEGLVTENLEDGVRLIQPIEPGTSIRKTLEIHLDPQNAALTLVHRLENGGLWPVELAPWAITQLPIGGTVVLPEQSGPLNSNGLLPNRKLVLWPYTRWQDPRLELADDVCLVHARALLPPVKIGYFNRTGWVGYLRGSVFFRKQFESDAALSYPDGGCNAECYCNDLFIELETLGALATIAPGKEAVHTERWEFFTGLEVPQTLDGVRGLMQTSGW